MRNLLRYSLILILVFGLILIRGFEAHLFYDPFLDFFKNDYLYLDAPKFDVFKLIGSTSLRYLLNSVLSLGIIYLVFRNKGAVKFSALIFGLAYLILISVFVFLVLHAKKENYYILFNIRRFLIQPILLLLLLPAFYYQKARSVM
ncbi:exosortase F system-associated membrane protein [Formosa haliotis]|uniref:exosortase F system-associated membrane protein n=1 Tax=Formosa haliotis TaxID=1555194 RepID=UPI000826DC46|nr:exosortase F system-associated protein [Formosa haliotis]